MKLEPPDLWDIRTRLTFSRCIAELFSLLGIRGMMLRWWDTPRAQRDDLSAVLYEISTFVDQLGDSWDQAVDEHGTGSVFTPKGKGLVALEPLPTLGSPEEPSDFDILAGAVETFLLSLERSAKRWRSDRYGEAI